MWLTQLIYETLIRELTVRSNKTSIGGARTSADGSHAIRAIRFDRWLKTRALSNQEKGLTAVLVVHEANRVIGYCGLAPTAVLPSTLPRSIRTGQPPTPVPCLLPGQLATDQDWIGKGIGTGLLKHALQRCVAAAELVGGRALIVNAVEIETAGFLPRRGF